MHPSTFPPVHERDRLRTFLLGLLCLIALVGFLDSGILHLKEIAAKTDPSALQSCSINTLFNCSSIAQSRYASLYGIPVSLIGMVYYQTIFMISLALLLGLRLNLLAKWIISIFAIGSLLFGYRLLYLSYFGIGVFCPYCLVSNVTSTLATFTWFSLLLRERRLTYRG